MGAKETARDVETRRIKDQPQANGTALPGGEALASDEEEEETGQRASDRPSGADTARSTVVDGFYVGSDSQPPAAQVLYARRRLHPGESGP